MDGVPSPSPNFPQPIENVEGNITIKVANGNDSTAQGYQEQTYNLNLDNIELCKIGNYEDYFYKENGKWYLYKEIGKTVLNGSESYTKTNTQPDDENLFSYAYILDDKKKGNGDILMNIFKKLGGPVAIKNATYESFWYNTGQTAVQIGFISKITTKELFAEWVENNNITIYFALETPTSTEITDTTLISQLEALSSLLLYQGVNHIWTETDGLEPNLQLTYKRKKTN